MRSMAMVSNGSALVADVMGKGGTFGRTVFVKVRQDLVLDVSKSGSINHN
jgi:hypothetical protein